MPLSTVRMPRNTIRKPWRMFTWRKPYLIRRPRSAKKRDVSKLGAAKSMISYYNVYIQIKPFLVEIWGATTLRHPERLVFDHGLGVLQWSGVVGCCSKVRSLGRMPRNWRRGRRVDLVLRICIGFFRLAYRQPSQEWMHWMTSNATVCPWVCLVTLSVLDPIDACLKALCVSFDWDCFFKMSGFIWHHALDPVLIKFFANKIQVCFSCHRNNLWHIFLSCIPSKSAKCMHPLSFVSTHGRLKATPTRPLANVPSPRATSAPHSWHGFSLQCCFSMMCVQTRYACFFQCSLQKQPQQVLDTNHGRWCVLFLSLQMENPNIYMFFQTTWSMLMWMNVGVVSRGSGNRITATALL